MSIALSNFTADFSLGSNAPPPTRIPQITSVHEWWRAGDRQILVETDKLSLIKGRIDDTKQATSGTSGERPAYSATGLSGKPAIIFDGVNDHLSFPLTGGSFFASDFSIVLIFKPTALPASQGYVLSTYGGANVGTLVYLTSSGNLRFMHGNASLFGKIELNKPNIAILSLGDKFIRGRINGIDMLSTLGNGHVTARSNLAHGATTLVMGSFTNVGPTFIAGAFAFSDFIPFTRDIVADLRTSVEIERMSRRIYGVELPAYL
ncbi:MAG TPA: hypothetical protein VIG36_10055 [Methylocystis sp.]